MSKRKLSCHCGGVEGQVEVPETGFEKIMRCNCSICKRKGYIIGVAGPNDFEITKGEKLLKLFENLSLTNELLLKARGLFNAITMIHNQLIMIPSYIIILSAAANTLVFASKYRRY